jgi:N-acetylglutamate synthase-like GNAT family acetyltransferase
VTTGLDVRDALTSDVPAMEACVRSAYEHYIARMGKPPGPMLADYAEIVRKHHAYVAELEGEVIGVLVLMQRGEEFLLDNVAVVPARQGQGVGRRLVGFTETKVR